MRIVGVDFTSAPRRSKPIVAAHGRAQGLRLRIDALAALPDFDAFERLLAQPGPWVGGFDFPFGLPQALLADLLWPKNWRPLVACRAASGAPSSTATAPRARPGASTRIARPTDPPAPRAR
jgi:hypothetical protein